MYRSAKNLEEFIETAEQKDLLLAVDGLIAKNFPSGDRRYFDNGRTYSSISYGKTTISSPGYEEAGLINFSQQKGNITVHFYGFVNRENLFDQFVDKFPKSTVGKGCLRIRSEKFLEEHRTVIEDIIKFYYQVQADQS